MRWLLFLSRVAFICNLFFLVSFTLRFGNWIGEGTTVSTVIILGYVLGVLVNPVTVFCYLFVFVFRKKYLEIIPSWLMVLNAAFLVLQLVFLLLLNIEHKPL